MCTNIDDLCEILQQLLIDDAGNWDVKRDLSSASENSMEPALLRH